MQARLVRALKRLTIDRPPNVLVFQLKRFEYMFHGSKITKKVQSFLLSSQPVGTRAYTTDEHTL